VTISVLAVIMRAVAIEFGTVRRAGHDGLSELLSHGSPRAAGLAFSYAPLLLKTLPRTNDYERTACGASSRA
jgi:hypothetical protein